MIANSMMNLSRQTNEALESVVNGRGEAVILCLVEYIDECLRKEFKFFNEEEVDVQLSRVIELFRLVRDKDVFKHHYKRSLAQRLIAQKSLSEEMEKSMISKLKLECGTSFTYKIETMFKDIAISNQLNIELRPRL